MLGGTSMGICEMDDEALRLCFAPDDRDPNNPDGSRPSEFYAPSGSGCWMTKDVHIAVF